MSERYKKSEQLLERALKTIPLGSQTFSKSKTQYPLGVSPYFIQRAKGSHSWDVDGNEYIDFVSSLAASTLGYNDPDVTSAVKKQLDDGIIFTLPHPIEVAVAEKLKEMVPCAEMTRFGKNGSDATAGAIRVARAFTGRDHVLACGYHGWQDWFIGSTARNRGVPQATRDLTHAFPYNDIQTFEALLKHYPNQVAAVILEPMNVVEPKPGFLEEVKRLTHEHGALLVFDETITGFRFSNGGAQELFNVVPDLATFGKGLANGYPVSAICGKAKYMAMMEEIFFSFTFGGEALSLAAALTTLEKLQREPVLKTIFERGTQLMKGTDALIQKHGLQDTLAMSGHPSWHFINFKDTGIFTLWQIKTLFLQEVFARGVLTLGSHNMSYSHSEQDVQATLKIYDEVFGMIKAGLEKNDLLQKLKCKPLEPLFKVR